MHSMIEDVSIGGIVCAIGEDGKKIPKVTFLTSNKKAIVRI